MQEEKAQRKRRKRQRIKERGGLESFGSKPPLSGLSDIVAMNHDDES